jgi:hypothetical protein
MKCPWLKQVQKKTYRHPFRPDDVSTAEVVISAFGECIRSECPFFELRTNHCRRSDQK